MSQRDGSHPGEPASQADRTLLGVAPPKLETAVDSGPRSPVFVRSGTSIADVEPPPLPRMALPSRPPLAGAVGTAPRSEAPRTLAAPPTGFSWVAALFQLPVRVAGGEVVMWMVLAPTLLVAAAFALLLGSLLGSASKVAAAHAVTAPSVATSGAAPTAATAAAATQAVEQPTLSSLAALEGKSPDSLSAGELLRLAEGRSETRRQAAKALRAKLEREPALVKEKAVQGELLHFVTDAETARDALSAMAAAESPTGPDLLYEVWAGTAARTEATELSRALLYSTDVRPKASAALGVALDLRNANACDQFKALLPKALIDGDRRALPPLMKLNNKRGCAAAKKDADCYACLRDQADELKATISAVKSRRPPSYPTP